MKFPYSFISSVYHTAALALIQICVLLNSTIAQEIVTPEQVQSYHLIRSEAIAESANGYAWIVRRMPDGFRPDVIRIEEGKAAVWTGPPGLYDVDLICQIDGVLSQAFAQVTILGQPPDPPPTPPSPPVPPAPPTPVPPPDPETVPADEFDNIGRQVFQQLATDANKDFPAAQLNVVYTQAALRLTGAQAPILPTINKAKEFIDQQESALLQGEHRETWRVCRTQIDTAWKKFEPSMNRTAAAKFLTAIAGGLSASQPKKLLSTNSHR